MPNLANFNQSWQSYRQKKQAIFGEKFHCQFCHLPATPCRLNLSFLVKKASQNSMGKKDDKVSNKNGYKRKATGKRRERDKRSKYVDPPCAKNKKAA